MTPHHEEPTPLRDLIPLLLMSACATGVQAQALEPAGRWFGDFSTGLSLSSGNTNSLSFNFATDSTYTRDDDKLSLNATYLQSRLTTQTNGVSTTTVTAEQWRAGSRFDRNLTPTEFGFVGAEFSHDAVLQLDWRSVLSSGLGRHVYKDGENSWDVYGGLSYREDFYSGSGTVIDDVTTLRYDTTESLLGEESTHEIAPGSRFKQKFVMYPPLLQASGTRATLDASLLVDVNKTLSLSVKLQGRYDSQAPAPASTYDLVLITGLSVKFGS